MFHIEVRRLCRDGGIPYDCYFKAVGELSMDLGAEEGAKRRNQKQSDGKI